HTSAVVQKMQGELELAIIWVRATLGAGKGPSHCWPGQVKQSGIGGYSALPALHQLRRDCRAEHFFVSSPTSGDLSIRAIDLLVAAMDGQPGGILPSVLPIEG